MKKVTMVLLFSLITIIGAGQEFLGIKPEGSRLEVVNKFIAKGFKVKPQSANQNVTSMVGNYAGTIYEVNIVNTPTSKKVWKIAVYLPEETNWYSLKDTYEKYVETLTKKYGDPSKSYAFFHSPYYEGDGYEMNAVRLEKCSYLTFWGETIYIEITQWRQVRISYENPVNADLKEKETEKLNSNIF